MVWEGVGVAVIYLLENHKVRGNNRISYDINEIKMRKCNFFPILCKLTNFVYVSFVSLHTELDIN